jgi:CD63 antigen
MVDGGMSCVKYLLFAFNLVFVIFGILLLYAGFSVVVKIGNYDQILLDAPNNVAISLIIVGFVIFLIAFLGCCGAIKENYCMLITFSSIMLAILLIELVGAGLILSFKNKLEKVTEDGIKNVIVKYNATHDNPLNQVLDDIQSNFECCGAVNSSDWELNGWFKNHTGTYPYSCCHRKGDNDHTNCTDTTKLFSDGCVVKLDREIKGSFALLGGIAIAIAVIQLIGIVFACSLSRSIKKEYEVV